MKETAVVNTYSRKHTKSMVAKHMMGGGHKISTDDLQVPKRGKKTGPS